MAYGDDPEAAAGVREGQILAGKYRVERVLGVGGMGVVVAAHNVVLDTKVALKFLLPEVLSNWEAVARFAREARAAVRIVNEHVARVLDVGTLDNGSPYIVMEFLEGGDLSRWLRERGPLPIEQALDFLLQACVAVADAHALGIVHRDLKPANLFCVRRSDGQFLIKVLDFGISKVTDLARGSAPPGLSVTKTGGVLGTPFYMSPEQIQNSKDVDTRTDIWALGVILFELLTGTVPFPGTAIGEIAVKVSTDPTPSLRGYRPEAPEALDAFLAKCLQKDRNRRFPNLAELALALVPLAPKRSKGWVERIAGIIQAAGLSTSALALPPSPHVGAETTATLGSVSPWSDSPRTTGSRTALLLGIGVVALALGSVATFGLLHRTSSAATNASSARSFDSAPLTVSAAPSPLSPSVAISLTPAPLGVARVVDEVPPNPSASTAQPQLAAVRSNAPSTAPPRAKPPSAAVVSSAAPRSEPSEAPLPSPATPLRTDPKCDPNYYLDARGEKRFKPECFGVSTHSAHAP